MKIQISKSDVAWNYLGIFMNLFGNFIILPILIIFLDTDTYGLWNIFISMGGIVTLFDFGFNVTFARNITYCWSGANVLYGDKVEYSHNNETNFYLMKKIVLTCKRVYFIISIAAAILLALAGSVYILYISGGLERSTVICAWGIYVLAIFCNLYFGYYDSFLRGVGAIANVNKLRIAARLIQIVIVFFTLYAGLGLVGASLSYLIYGLVFRMAARHVFYKYEGIGKSLEGIILLNPKEEIKELFSVIWHNAWRDGMVQAADYLSNQLMVVIASLYLSLSSIGAYSLIVQLAQAIVTIAAATYNAYQPTLQSAYVKRDTERIRDTMSAILLSYSLVSVIGVIALIFVVLPVIGMIKPALVLSSVIVLEIWLYQFVIKGRNCYTSYLASTNRIIYAKSFLVSGVLTVVMAFVLEYFLRLDIQGIVCAQLLGQAVYNLWYWPKMVHAEIGLRVKDIVPRGLKELKRLAVMRG